MNLLPDLRPHTIPLTVQSMKSSVAWLLCEKLLRVLNGIFVVAAVARHLGPESFGYLSIAFATIGIFSAAAGMGAEHINISQLAKHAELDQLVFNSVLWTRIAWGTLVTTGAVVFLLLQNAGTIDPTYLILLTAVPMAAFSLFANKIAAHAEFKALSILAITGLLFGSTIRLFGVTKGYGVEYFAGCMVIEAAVTTILNGAYLFKRYESRPTPFRTDMNLMRSYFHQCLPTAISAALITIYLRIELFVVWHSLGQEAAGQWAAAMMFLTPWGMVASAILPVANQILSRKQLDPGSDYGKQMVLLIRFMLAISFVFVLINILIVGILAPVLLGKKYISIVSVVAICSVGLIPLFMGSVQEIWIAHQGITKVVLKKVIIGLPLSVLLLWSGAVLYGLPGIAVAMVVSNFVTALLLNFVLDREFIFLQLRALGLKYGRTN